MNLRVNLTALMVIPNLSMVLDSGAPKHMTGNLKLLIIRLEVFLGKPVYFVEGLGHNLFSVGQFCESDVEVLSEGNTCLARTQKGVDFVKEETVQTNLYTIISMKWPLIPILPHGSSNLYQPSPWLSASNVYPTSILHHNDLAKTALVTRSSKNKYHREQNSFVPPVDKEKAKGASHPPKPVPISKQRLHLLHMDLCGPMRIASINGKRIAMLLPCYTQNRSIHSPYELNKTPYSSLTQKTGYLLSFMYSGLSLSKIDREEYWEALEQKGDIGFFTGYSLLIPVAYRGLTTKDKENHGNK
ncbi:hypothetical protein Tco_1506945 [Tanacetum coccineum]